jgi:hypothetical protein
MLAGTFENSNLASVEVPLLSRPLEMSSLSIPHQLLAKRVNMGSIPRTEWPDDAVVEGGAYKGACWAFAIEGAAAICIYGIWHFCSVIR